MCIIFFHFNPNSSSAYRLILAANRDEFYSRPSKPAEFWTNNRSILSGLDMEKGKEGGTWLGMSKKGKCAALTNYLQSSSNMEGLGRGFLVPNFLTQDIDGLSYLKKISLQGHLYNGFNLLTADFRSGPKKLIYTCASKVRRRVTCTSPKSTKGDMMCYYGNKSHEEPRVLDPGIYGLCNSLLETPWKKLVHGKKLFTETIQKNCSLSPKNLTQELLNVMTNEEIQLPAADIEEQGQDFIRPILKEFSALFIRTPLYGTRTSTIILVDAEGHVTFTERCLLEPGTTQWKLSSYQFDLEM
ncbi:transport and Golgi organization protein 2 homolog isoform X2 [Mobula hypostoma]|uniref:transport and Golgi organization protein 2 homolog isoform X2 n=1 Tax=Mobula hypostoma TaxID=723540 RepID=UPI002FC36556